MARCAKDVRALAGDESDDEEGPDLCAPPVATAHPCPPVTTLRAC